MGALYDWNTKGNERYGSAYYDRVSSDPQAIKRHACENIRPLYTSPQKREPLSDGTTADMWHANKKATHADSYWAGVYDAEKAHGIGVENETI